MWIRFSIGARLVFISRDFGQCDIEFSGATLLVLGYKPKSLVLYGLPHFGKFVSGRRFTRSILHTSWFFVFSFSNVTDPQKEESATLNSVFLNNQIFFTGSKTRSFLRAHTILSQIDPQLAFAQRKFITGHYDRTHRR